MAGKYIGNPSRHHGKHRWNVPDGWSDSDIFGYDTAASMEDDEIATEVMDTLYPNRKLSKKGVVRIVIKK